MKFIAFVMCVACGGQTRPVNACATPSSVVTCDEQAFYTFELVSIDGAQPTWEGSQCDLHACERGDACEVERDGVFLEGVCE